MTGRRDARVAEEARLESVYASKAYQGFESPSLRDNNYIINLNSKIKQMKKAFAIITVIGMLAFGMTVTAQESSEAVAEEAVTEQVAEETETATEEVAAEEVVAEEVAEEGGIHKALKQKFIEGGAGYMAAVAFCLIFGLALAIERIIYLSLSSVNNKKFAEDVEKALNEGGVEKAKELCKNTRGPVAAIFYQGLLHYDEGIEQVEKTVTSYGNVQAGQLEKNLSWIGLFIALAPMLGFMGTVVGMIQAFDKIQQVGDISATVVAGGIKVALLTTLAGLIVGIILQLFYNFVLTKIEAIVSDMEDTSITLLDIVAAYNKKKA